MFMFISEILSATRADVYIISSKTVSPVQELSGNGQRTDVNFEHCKTHLSQAVESQDALHSRHSADVFLYVGLPVRRVDLVGRRRHLGQRLPVLQVLRSLKVNGKVNGRVKARSTAGSTAGSR